MSRLIQQELVSKLRVGTMARDTSQCVALAAMLRGRCGALCAQESVQKRGAVPPAWSGQGRGSEDYDNGSTSHEARLKLLLRTNPPAPSL